jgi:hypothetical protein
MDAATGIDNLLDCNKLGDSSGERKYKLTFDSETGKLKVVLQSQCIWGDGRPQSVGLSIAEQGFFGGSFDRPTPQKDKLVINPTSDDKEKVIVETMHISCQSDTYHDAHNYGGVIIYQYNDKSDWRTANNTHCKSGYIVIQDTDSENVKRYRDEPTKEPGAVHGAVYRNAFDESVNDAEVIGEGFAIRNGKFEMCSSVFNNPPGSAFHDRRRQMHELSVHCVTKVVEYWKTAGPCWVRQRNFEVKELLEDFHQD